MHSFLFVEGVGKYQSAASASSNAAIFQRSSTSTGIVCATFAHSGGLGFQRALPVCIYFWILL